MSSVKKINLLVIPDLFPGYKDDVQGIFVRDYLTAVAPYCNITVLFVRLSGAQKGLNTSQEGPATVYRYCFSDKKIPAYLKPLYYVAWFLKGYSLGKKLKDTEIIHAHGSILSGNLSSLLSKHLKIPFIITEHQGPFSMISNSAWKLRLAKRAMQKANALLTVSDHLRQEVLQSGITPQKIYVTHNPVDTNLFSLKPPGLHHTILFIGRLDEFKGGLRSLKAFHKISKQNPDWRFAIGGEGEEAEGIKNYVSAHMLHDKVHIIGKLTKAEIVHEMHQADIYVFPSRHESFGLVAVEAMSCGLPAIVTNRTAPKEYVSPDTGLLVDPDDIEAIAVAMQQAVSNLPIYRPEAIRAGIVERFGFENFGKKINDIYRSLL